MNDARRGNTRFGKANHDREFTIACNELARSIERMTISQKTRRGEAARARGSEPQTRTDHMLGCPG